jgi:hypothetical protein
MGMEQCGTEERKNQIKMEKIKESRRGSKGYRYQGINKQGRKSTVKNKYNNK